MTGAFIAFITFNPITYHIAIRFYFAVIHKIPTSDRVQLNITKWIINIPFGDVIDASSSEMLYSEEFANYVKNESARTFMGEAIHLIQEGNLVWIGILVSW